MTTPPFALDSTSLRKLAEMVDGVRDKPYALIDENGMRMSDSADSGRDVICIPVRTPDVVRSRRKITRITFHLDDGSAHDLYLPDDTSPDALFLSESAVEKFLVPYYAAKNAAAPGVDRVIRKLLDTFDTNPLPGEEQGSATGPETVEVYALAHLPKSIYTSEADPAADALADLGVTVPVGENDPRRRVERAAPGGGDGHPGQVLELAPLTGFPAPRGQAAG